MRRIVVVSALGILVGAAIAAAGERGPRFSVVSASYRPAGDKIVLSVVVKNESEFAGSATVRVKRELSRCVEEDTTWCVEHPAAPGETCVNPCRRYETEPLGTDEATTRTVEPGNEQTVEILVPNEEAYAEISAIPGGRLAFGVEIHPK